MARLLVALALLARAEAEPSTPWSPASLEHYRRVRSGLWHGTGTLHNTLTGAFVANVEMIELVSLSQPADEGEGSHKGALGYRTERLLVHRNENGTLLTSFHRNNVPPVRYTHDVALSISSRDGNARGKQTDEGRLFIRAFTPSGREVASAWDSGRGPSWRGLTRTFELSLRPTKPAKSERSRYAREQMARSRSPLAETPEPVRARFAFFGSKPQEPTYQTPVPVGASPREEYSLLLPALRWRPPSLTYRRTGRGASWYGSAVCTLELQMHKVDQDALFGSPSSRRLAKECLARLRAIDVA